jgi:hypothetical protein
VVIDEDCCGFKVAVNYAVVEEKLQGKDLR